MDLTGLLPTAVIASTPWSASVAGAAPQLAAHAMELVGALPQVLAVKPLPEVIDGLRNWVMGILAAVASLFLAVAGLRYVGSGGDPAVVEQAKGNFKAALVGYGLAILSPVFLEILQGILGA